jgi:hypothetical protein
MNLTKKSFLAAALAAVAFGPAFAEKGGGGHGGGHGGDKHAGKAEVRVVERHDGDRGKNRGHDVRTDTRVLGNAPVVVDPNFHRADPKHANGCPPGLAKKNNGCMPPGQAKKLAVGQALPAGAVFTVPQPILSTLPPPPIGHRYAVVNNQVVLVSSGNIIVDILRSVLG